jgi:hypothetical protein
MATVTLNQNVANSPTNSYQVGVFKQSNGTELQAVVCVDSSGNELPASIPLVPFAYDYISLSYTGDNVTTVVYKTGGALGTTVATLTLTYSGSNVTSVTRT